MPRAVATATDVYATDGQTGAVWRIPLSGAAATQIGAGGNPVVSPKGIPWADANGIRAYTP